MWEGIMNKRLQVEREGINMNPTIISTQIIIRWPNKGAQDNLAVRAWVVVERQVMRS
jgi:hypothetical protein